MVSRLIDQISEFDAAPCYMVLNRHQTPQYTSRSANNMVLTVEPGGGTYDQGWLDGGGSEQCLENSHFTVSIWTFNHLDQAGRDVEFLTNSTTGVLDIKQDVLKALTDVMLADPDTAEELLLEYLHPISSDAPERYDQGSLGVLRVLFEYNFIWDLG